MNLSKIRFALQVFLPTACCAYCWCTSSRWVNLSESQTNTAQLLFSTRVQEEASPSYRRSHFLKPLVSFSFNSKSSTFSRSPDFNVSSFIWPHLRTTKWYNPLLVCTYQWTDDPVHLWRRCTCRGKAPLWKSVTTVHVVVDYFNTCCRVLLFFYIYICLVSGTTDVQLWSLLHSLKF